jgi:Spy/CpxP family protein refolding chaperone
MECGNRFALMADLLGLSADQQKQVKSALSAHRQQDMPVFKELRDNERQLRRIATATPFDKNAAQALELKQAQLRTQLLADRIEMQRKIEAVLTPAQRQMAKTLRELMREGRRHHMPEKGFGPMDGPPLLGE